MPGKRSAVNYDLTNPSAVTYDLTNTSATAQLTSQPQKSKEGKDHCEIERADDARYDAPRYRNFDTEGASDAVHRRERLEWGCSHAVIAVTKIDIAAVLSSPKIASSPTRPSKSVKLRIGIEEREKAVWKALGLAETTAVAYESIEQEEALERIINSSNSALAVVLPIGEETLSDAKSRGINAVEWSRDLYNLVEIVFISAGKLSNTFFDYSACMVEKGLVPRVFVDECHLAITAHSCQQEIGLAGEAEIHRGPDDHAHGNTTAHKSKIVVYCFSKAECEELAEALGCNYFYSSSADNADVIKSWEDARGYMVATTALGIGVDYTGVALAVHIGMLYSFVDFAQESGRVSCLMGDFASWKQPRMATQWQDLHASSDDPEKRWRYLEHELVTLAASVKKCVGLGKAGNVVGVRDMTTSNDVFADSDFDDEDEDDDETRLHSQQPYWRKESGIVGSVLEPDRLRELSDE
ncbi:hypothetical protein Q7P35_002903 [Cladosporium inversicolor]